MNGRIADGPASSPPETRLVVVRHGETEWSRSGRHTGRTDVPLSEEGRAQADRIGRALRGRTFSHVLSSPLERAVETCRIAGFGDRAELVDDLMEWDYGIYEGRTRVEIAAEIPGWTIWTAPIPGGESLDVVGRRADRVIARTLPLGGDILVFAHGHILRVLAARWIEQPPVLGSRLELATATVSELGWEQERRVIERWNSLPPASL
ncbi:MAG TPA: histidine phosphatase family protein [Candidatus Limnocylindrales bacterium]|nr:histidine phosphatase family protein [Candidatus Limnocylindrales bacterium]